MKRTSHSYLNSHPESKIVPPWSIFTPSKNAGTRYFGGQRKMVVRPLWHHIPTIATMLWPNSWNTKICLAPNARLSEPCLQYREPFQIQTVPATMEIVRLMLEGALTSAVSLRTTVSLRRTGFHSGTDDGWRCCKRRVEHWRWAITVAAQHKWVLWCGRVVEFLREKFGKLWHSQDWGSVVRCKFQLEFFFHSQIWNSSLKADYSSIWPRTLPPEKGCETVASLERNRQCDNSVSDIH